MIDMPPEEASGRAMIVKPTKDWNKSCYSFTAVEGSSSSGSTPSWTIWGLMMSS
jgi:hypothetical protein